MEQQERNSKKRRYVYINEETDSVSIHECLIKNIRFNKFATHFYIDWSQGYGTFVIKCLYPELIEYHITSSPDKIGYQNCVINHLMITSFSYLKDEEGYTIQFNFDDYPIGYIRMHCIEFIFECPSPPIAAGGNEHRIPWDPIKPIDALDY